LQKTIKGISLIKKIDEGKAASIIFDNFRKILNDLK
jgi:hypothetical protein